MNDLRRIMQEGVPDPEAPRKLPSLTPWALIALVLILISLGIHLFWPTPVSKPLPSCGEGAEQQTACIRHGS